MMRSFLLLVLLATAGMAWGSEHPGNVYVAGEDVRVGVPAGWAGWRAIDVEGKEVGTGKGASAELGKLPVGYYEVKEKGGTGIVTAGVVAESTAVEDTPIALDAGMAWFYPEAEQIRDACRLCRLAGVTWVRDRSSWPEIETARGTWAPDGRYERAMRVEHESGLKVLQVNHISPMWAGKDGRRFPEDLRDVYNFYKGVAKRWEGLADAIEPWNEPDIELFGGQTGCEIASFQKAAYLGLKAGNPRQKVNETVFAIDRPETLEEFGANEVWPYFDRYDLHHYKAMTKYPELYGRHRAVSGGRPMWTTEFNLTVKWADEKTHEPSEEQLRVQAYRVAKVFSMALNEGVEKAFYFILGHYVERNIQYGLVHQDLTPRPAYVAMAAVGRLLNGADRLGRVDLGDEKLKGYVFKTVVDGEERETLVAWSETKASPLAVRAGEKAYDYLGREMPGAASVDLTRAPVFVVMPRGGSKGLKVEPPPAKAEWESGEASTVVLQLIGQGDVDRSAFQLDGTKQLRLVAYNFGEKVAKGKLTVEGATVEGGDLDIAPGARVERVIRVEKPGQVTVRAVMGEAGHAIVSARVVETVPGGEAK